MKLFSKNILKKDLVLHPYEDNPGYEAHINTFFYSPDKKAIAGYWEAPIGWFNVEIKNQSELNFVIEGEIEIVNFSENKRKITAKKGDIFLVENGDKIRWVIKKPIRTIFFIYPASIELTNFFENLKKK